MKETKQMKKLMIAAATICAAVCVQAASYSWQSGSILYTWDSPAPDWPTMAGNAAYFVFADAYSQADLVDDFASADGVNLTKLNATGGKTVVADDGTIAATSATSAYTADMPAYFVVIGDDTMFISGSVIAGYDALGNEKPVVFGDEEVGNLWTGTRNDAAAGYVGAGYYAAVPEPTTGLLMLLGLAGLTLCRRRA